MRHVPVVMFALILASTAHAAPKPDTTTPPQSTKSSWRILDTGSLGHAALGGERAGRTEPSIEVTDNAEIYTLLWRQFVRPETPPAVDFTKETVIFLLEPMRRTGGFAFAVRSVDATTAPIRIVTERAESESDDKVAPGTTAPYAVIAVPIRSLEGADWTDREVEVARWQRQPARNR